MSVVGVVVAVVVFSLAVDIFVWVMTPEVVCTVVLLMVFVAAVDVSALVVLVPAADKRDL